MAKLKKAKFVLGLTGGIGCGKSTVARLFKSGDCLVIDADLLAHQILSPGTAVYRKTVKAFGANILQADKSVDRFKLAQVVFAAPQALVKLNRIIHPELIRRIKQLIFSTQKRIIILDAALIVEAGLVDLVDKLVVVKAQKEQQIRRGRQKLGLTRKQMMQRIKSQISQNKKLRFADFIIDNSGRLSETKKQVSKIRRQLWKS
jgi:dephospho-CoA kinase